MHRLTLRAIPTLVLLLFCGASVPVAHAGEADPRSTMHEIFENITRLVPLVLDEKAYESRAGVDEASRLLSDLVRSSNLLEAHALRRDGDFRFIARSLAIDFREAEERMANGQPDQARFFVAAAIENCVQCHSRLPKARDFPLANRLTDNVTLSQLPPQERALFLVATRSFSEALNHWEAFFALPQTKPSHLSTQAELDQYLRVAISVQRDPERARATLEAMRVRPDADEKIRRRLEVWSGEMLRLAPVIRGPASLDEARLLLGDPAPTVDADLRRIREQVAMSLLLRLIDSTPATRDSAEMLGEAYYRMGTTEARSHLGLWHPQTEFHLESAIRMAPWASWARDALAIYEETVTLGHTGSGGTLLPESVAAKLASLESKIAEAEKRNPQPQNAAPSAQ